MTRVEIIGNQILLDDVLTQIELRVPKQYYTVVPVMRAKGKRGKANGDEVWMETNFMCVLFVGHHSDVAILRDICDVIQKDSPKNALTFFESVVEPHESDNRHSSVELYNHI